MNDVVHPFTYNPYTTIDCEPHRLPFVCIQIQTMAFLFRNEGKCVWVRHSYNRWSVKQGGHHFYRQMYGEAYDFPFDVNAPGGAVGRAWGRVRACGAGLLHGSQGATCEANSVDANVAEKSGCRGVCTPRTSHFLA